VPRCLVGEGPLWDVAEQALFLIDILGEKVHRYDPAGGTSQQWSVPDISGGRGRIRERLQFNAIVTPHQKP
jgi:sugar lactone lactonase YvrE